MMVHILPDLYLFKYQHFEVPLGPIYAIYKPMNPVLYRSPAVMEVGRDRPKDAPFSVQSHDVFFPGKLLTFLP